LSGLMEGLVICGWCVAQCGCAAFGQQTARDAQGPGIQPFPTAVLSVFDACHSGAMAGLPA
jgi:hypothetical protein